MASALVDLPAVELHPDLWIFLKVLMMFRQLLNGAAFLLFEPLSGGFLGIDVLQRALSEYWIGVQLADRFSLLAASKKPPYRSHSGFRRGCSFGRGSTSP
jgi:hypothetical protein